MKIVITERLVLTTDRLNWQLDLSESAPGREDGKPRMHYGAFDCLIAFLEADKWHLALTEELKPLREFAARLRDAERNVSEAFTTSLKPAEVAKLGIVLQLGARFRFHHNDKWSWHLQTPNVSQPSGFLSAKYYPSLSLAMTQTLVASVRLSDASGYEAAYRAVGDAEDLVLPLKTQLPAAYFGHGAPKPPNSDIKPGPEVPLKDPADVW